MNPLDFIAKFANWSTRCAMNSHEPIRRDELTELRIEAFGILRREWQENDEGED